MCVGVFGMVKEYSFPQGDDVMPVGVVGKKKWEAPRVVVLDAGETESGTRAGGDGSFNS